jgi:tetratricopeptide (TPR) repeat protein
MTAEEYIKIGNVLKEIGDYKSAIENYMKAIEKYTNAIEINPNDADAYINRGYAKSALGEYQTAIDDFNKAIEISPKLAEAYGNRGNAKYVLGYKEEAISDYTTFIDIAQKDFRAYFLRGNTKYDLGYNQAAIDDYDEAIKINSNYADAYNSRGNAKYASGKKQDAIDDYTKAIEINQNYAEAYYNRSVAKYDSAVNKEAAIADCNKAIKINPHYAKAYLCRAECYYKMEKFKEAKDDFKEAGKDILEILNFLDEENRKGVIEEELLNDLLNDDKHYIKTVKLQDLNDNNIREKYAKAYLHSIYIISILHISKKSDELPVSYYTKTNVADLLLIKDKDEKVSKFRLNSINYFNDPSEGEILREYLFDKKTEKDSTNNMRAFAACFTFNPDCLNQFRLYGKTNNVECTGVSITFNENFFADNVKLATALSMSKSEAKLTTILSIHKDEAKSKISSSTVEFTKHKEKEIKHALYRCIYIDPETKRLISVGHKEDFLFYREKKGDKIKAYNEYIKKLTQEVSNELEMLKRECEGLDDNILSQLFINLRYLTKHVAFKEEQECRIVKIKSLIDPEVNVSEDHKQIYLEYLECKNYVKGIVFGSNVSSPDIFRDRLLREKYTFPCRKSQNPFA